MYHIHISLFGVFIISRLVIAMIYQPQGSTA